MSERERQPDLEALARSAAAGAEGAFSTLAALIYPQLFRWALVRTGDRADAEDVCQEAMWRIHRDISRFDGRSKLSSWSYRITANAAVDYYRRNARHSKGRVELEAVAERSSRPADDLIDAQRGAELVQILLQQLPQRQRTVLYLVDLMGHPPREVAEILDMNANTVRANLLKARRALRRRILETHPEVVEGRQ